MTSATPPAPPGWYLDPEDPDHFLRYWDGMSWTVRQQRPPQAAGRASFDALTGPVAPVGRTVSVLAQVIGVAIVFVVGVQVVRVWLYSRMGAEIEDIIESGDTGRLERLEDIENLTIVALVALVLVAGVSWMVWQHRLAKAVPREELRRTPPWHAWSWVIPIGNLWMPIQNVRDLWRGLGVNSSRAVLGFWWAAVVAGGLLGRIANGQVDGADSVDDFRAATTTLVVSESLTLVAAVLAVYVVRRLTRAGLDAAATDRFSAEGNRAA